MPLIVVLHRENKPRARWRKVGAAETHAQAVALVNAAGDWWIATEHDRLPDTEHGEDTEVEP